MRSRAVVIALLLAATSVLAATQAIARPHEPPPKWRDPNGPPTEPEIWLRRLVGTYHVEGQVHVLSMGDCGELPPDPAQQQNPGPPPPPACQTINGMGDCIGIGAGPGVQCIFNVSWIDLYDISFEGGTVDAQPGAVSYLNPAMALFGIDPVKGAINYLLVDNKGLPEGGPGSNSGYFASFTTRCVNNEVGCLRTIRIEARPDASIVYLRIDIETEASGDPITNIVMSLRRIPSALASTRDGARR